MASLVHDDVIDDANSRRNMDSIKARFGNVAAVTMGVYLYSVALKLIARSESITVLDELSSTVKKMCEGELKQQDFINHISFDKKDYFEIVNAKTAVLFKSASLIGHLLFSVDSKYKHSLLEFSFSLGNAFQLTDDFLDLMDNKNLLNKSIGQDFLKGQYTLPMIFAFEKMTEKEKDYVFSCVKEKNLDGLKFIQSIFEKYELTTQFNTIILNYVSKARNAVNQLPQNQFNQALLFLIEYVQERTHLN